MFSHSRRGVNIFIIKFTALEEVFTLSCRFGEGTATGYALTSTRNFLFSAHGTGAQ